MVDPKQDQKKIKYSWNEIETAVEALADMIKSRKLVFNSIYGLPRGGYIPAVMLSHKIGVPIVEQSGVNKGTLVLDDINDSGNTFKEMMDYLSLVRNIHPTTACLYERKGSIYTTELRSMILLHKDWIVFPWESD